MCSPKCAKYGLVIINVIFIIFGLALLIPGILVVLNEDVINEEVLPALQSISIASSNLGDLAKGLSISLIVIGSFIVVLSFVGACGACCEMRCCLIIYMVVVAILFIAKAIIVILWIVMNAEIQDKLRSEMKKGLAKFSEDSLIGDETSSGWNYLQMNLECCAVDVVTNDTNDYHASSWHASTSPVASNEVPLSCCPGVTSSSYFNSSATLDTCVSKKGDAPVGHYSKGCYDAVKEFITKYSIAFIVVGIFVLLLEVAAIIFACMVCKQAGKVQVV